MADGPAQLADGPAQLADGAAQSVDGPLEHCLNSNQTSLLPEVAAGQVHQKVPIKTEYKKPWV